jgi:FkbM family methyltransferase
MSIFESFSSQVTLVDIGASGGVHPRWKLLGNNLRVIGFEPDARAFDKLPKIGNTIWLNTPLYADNQWHDLYITREQTNVSLLKPNLPIIDTLCLRHKDFEIVRTVPIQCERLDDVLNREGLHAHVLKLDTQGTELYILQGASEGLKGDVFAIESEVMFVDIYEGQAQFSDFHNYLRDFGYCLMDYGNVAYLKGKHTVGVGGKKGLMIAADALYFKRIDKVQDFINVNDTDALERAIMICVVYGYPDYALELCYAIKRGHLIPTDLLEIYEARLKRIKHFSRFFSHFPGRSTLSGGFRLLADIFLDEESVYWMNQLGNPTRYFKF